MAEEIEKRLEKKFDVIRLQYKVKRRHMRSWAYINFLQTERLIMVPQLGMEEDEQAIEQIISVFPDIETIGIPALEAVRRGGALNCISWNVKKPIEPYPVELVEKVE
jgi:agmatine/peptidylarginine deiminase